MLCLLQLFINLNASQFWEIQEHWDIQQISLLSPQFDDILQPSIITIQEAAKLCH